jgi:hypothetical protein
LDLVSILVGLVAGSIGGLISAAVELKLATREDAARSARRLELEHMAEESKKLRTLIGQYHGRFLEAALDWDRRMWQLYDDPDGPYLDVDDRVLEDYTSEPHRAVFEEQYLFLSYVYRFLALCSLARRFESEAFYIDAKIALASDLEVVKFTKSFLWVMTSPDLHRPFHDGMPGRDHFRNDEFRPLLDACYAERDHGQIRITDFDYTRFMHLLQSTEHVKTFKTVLFFFDGIKKTGDVATDAKVPRYRWDRLVALHVLVMAFIREIGYEWQRPTPAQIADAGSNFNYPGIRMNLINHFPALGFGASPNMQEIADVLRRQGASAGDI